MRMELKEEFKTDIYRSERGYLVITQDGVRIKLSGGQLVKLLKWLEDGNGLNLEADWNNGIDQAES